MTAQWRTSAALALCRWMLDAREFDVLPILGDALQDAGCTDGELIAQCYDASLSPILAERVVNLVYSDETAAAVRWLEQFARDISYDDEDEPPMYTYERIVEVARRGLESGHMHFGTDAGADFFRSGDEYRRQFFRNWSLVTGIPVPAETQDRIGVSCAC